MPSLSTLKRLAIHTLAISCFPQSYPFLYFIYLQYLDSFQNICASSTDPVQLPPVATSVSRHDRGFKVLKKEVSHQCRKALYFASFSLCVGAIVAQKSTTTAPKLFGYMTIGMFIGGACHTVVISRFMRLLESNHQESMSHWNTHSVYIASIIVAFPEAFTLGSIVSMGTCVALYLHQGDAPTLQLTPDKHGGISIDASTLQTGHITSSTSSPNTLPQWATILTVGFFLLNAVQFAIVSHALKWLCLTNHRQNNDVPAAIDSV